MNTSEDQRCRRCPKLGHEVEFSYCRQMQDGDVCPLILDCWWEAFDVQGFLKQNLPEADFLGLQGARQSKPKVLSLIELIEQAKKSKETQ